MKFVKKKESASEANVFLHNEKLRRKISNTQFLNWEFFLPADFEYKNFQINIFWRRNIFQKLSFWVQFFIEKSDFDQKFTTEKKRSDSICSTENNNFFTFRAYFKRHDFEASLPLENQSLKWNSLKWFRFWSIPFPLKWDFELKVFQHVRFWIENLSSRKISKTKLFE